MSIELNSLADIQHELPAFTTIFLAWDFDIKPTSPTPLTPVNWKCFQFQLAQTRSAFALFEAHAGSMEDACFGDNCPKQTFLPLTQLLPFIKIHVEDSRVTLD
jgi:hypothetical protein